MLLERDTHLAVLRSRVEALRLGTSAVVLISGEPGIGKTTLLTALINDLPAAVRCWTGRCDDLVAARPLDAFHDIARDIRDQGRTPESDDDSTPEHPSLADALARGDPARVMAAVHDELTHDPPVVLVVDDVHWADDATLDVLAYLARRLTALRVLLIVSFRPQEVTRHRALSRFLSNLPPATTTLLPASLSSPAVAALSAGSGWDVDRLVELTGGNPFYVTETLAAGAATGGGQPTPTSVTATVLARLNSLEPLCRAALERLSVWPGEVEFDLAEALVGNLDVLGDAEQCGIITTTERGLRFRHEIARLATEATLTGVRRRGHDRQVIAILRERGESDLPRLVHHAIHCGDAEAIVTYAPRAADYCSRVGAHRQALRLHEATLGHEERMDRRQLALTCDAYAWELHIAHRFGEAVDTSRRAVRLLTVLGDEDALARSLVRMTRHLLMAAEPDEALASARQAVAVARGPLRAEALLALGAVQALCGAPDEAAQTLRQAQAQAPDSAQVASLVTNYLAQVEPELAPDQRIGLLRKALQVAGDAYEAAARAYTNLGELLYRYGLTSQLDDLLSEGTAFAREHGFWSHAFNLEAHRALSQARRGRWVTACEQLQSEIDRYEDLGVLSHYAVVPLARLQARRGEAAAGQPLREGRRTAQRIGTLLALGYAGAALSEWAWLNQQPAAALEVLAGWEPHAHRPTAEPFDAEIRCYATRLGLGEQARGAAPPRARSGGMQAEPAGSSRGVHDRGESLPARAWRLGAAGRHAEAATVWEGVGDPYEAAIERVQCLADSRAGEEAAIEAVRTLDRLGALPAGRWARGRLAARGVRSIPRRPLERTRTHPGGLTDRELEVAALLQQDLTNVEIAARLYLSVRTVDHHVSAILGKLGVTGRRAARTRLAELTQSADLINPAAPGSR